MSERWLNYLEREDKLKTSSYSIVSKLKLKIGNLEGLEGKDIHQANHQKWLGEQNHQIIGKDIAGCSVENKLELFNI